MPRRNRCVLPGVACHITQRGVDRRTTFGDANDHSTYLNLLRHNLADAGVRILGYCLMTNHVHIIAVPEAEDSLAILFRRVHGRYAQYFNARHARTGHLWQNRFYACCLDRSHLWRSLVYVERNPVRAGIVSRASEYAWSSAAAHLGGKDISGVLDLNWWQAEGPPDWAASIAEDDADTAASLRRCTHSGRPFGEEPFIADLSSRFGRHWVRGRPRPKPATTASATEQKQQILFS